MILAVNTIANFLNNTFAGTLLAGVCIAFLGLRLYRKQKKLDIAFAKQARMHELATALLTHINVAVKDYKGQISIHDGRNSSAKVLFEKMKELDPTFYTRDTSARFNDYAKTITHDFNELSTPLTLDLANEASVETLANLIPRITFSLSMATTLPSLDPQTLNEISEGITKFSNEATEILVRVINGSE